MSRYDVKHVNPDLASERSKATFDVKKLINFRGGGEDVTRRKQEIRSNIRGLETTATYDPVTEEFVLNTPKLTSMKWWPGGLGRTTNHAAVMAHLYSHGKNHGIHPFLVPLRDIHTHEPLPGVTVGDIGPKLGWNTIDNGFLRLDNVRIPRENMLMKTAQLQLLGDPSATSGTRLSFLSRPEGYEEAIRRAGVFIQQLRLHPEWNNSVDKVTVGRMILPNAITPLGLHETMFMVTMENQCTEEQKEKWMEKVRNFEIIGTYAQTELGHGSNIRGLETTATYDPVTEEFVLNTPKLTSMKWWPGGLGRTTNHAAVMAHLYSHGKNHGIHPFLVPLRDIHTHEPLPGVTVGDIGPKLGWNTIDNGFLRLDNVRIPRENMLMKTAQVSKDGTFKKVIKHDKVTYGTLVQTRAVSVSVYGGWILGQAVTIAVRYSCVRRQSEIQPGGGEMQVINYRAQQYKLFPQLATAYANLFAGNKLMQAYDQANPEIMKGNLQLLPELHAVSSGLKAIAMWNGLHGIEQCRLACGGHGYSHASGLPQLYTLVSPGCTIDGENTVLYLQTARFLVKSYMQAQNTRVPHDSRANYLSVKTWDGSALNKSLNNEDLLEAYRYRTASLTAAAGARLSRLVAAGNEEHIAWNLSSVDLVKAAKAFSHMYLVQSFFEAVSDITDDPLKIALTDLFQLFACYGIVENSTVFLQNGYLSSSQLNVIHDAIVPLLDKIRLNAVALVDAFDFTDHQMNSALGRFDGNVYFHLLNWARGLPLNKTEVHDSIKYLKPFWQASGNQSKL